MVCILGLCCVVQLYLEASLQVQKRAAARALSLPSLPSSSTASVPIAVVSSGPSTTTAKAAHEGKATAPSTTSAAEAYVQLKAAASRVSNQAERIETLERQIQELQAW